MHLHENIISTPNYTITKPIQLSTSSHSPTALSNRSRHHIPICTPQTRSFPHCLLSPITSFSKTTPISDTHHHPANLIIRQSPDLPAPEPGTPVHTSHKATHGVHIQGTSAVQIPPFGRLQDDPRIWADLSGRMRDNGAISGYSTPRAGKGTGRV